MRACLFFCFYYSICCFAETGFEIFEVNTKDKFEALLICEKTAMEYGYDNYPGCNYKNRSSDEKGLYFWLGWLCTSGYEYQQCESKSFHAYKVYFDCIAPFEYKFDKGMKKGSCVKWCSADASILDLIFGRCKPREGESIPKSCPAMAGNPINTATGEKIEFQSPDYSGQGSFPINLTRNYRSYRAPEMESWVEHEPPINGEANAVKYVQPEDYKGPVYPELFIKEMNAGYKKWQHNYQVELLIYPDLTKLAIHRANGEMNYYSVQSDSLTYLSKNFTGGEVVKTGEFWLFNRPDGFVETFNSDGKLVKITNQQGLSQILEYSVQGTLASVTDPAGRQLLFAYDEFNRLSTVTAPNGGITQYEYGEYGNLVAVIHPDETSQDLTNNPITKYQYSDESHPYYLTGEVDGNQNAKGTWAYDGSGKAVSSVNNNGHKATSVSYGDGKSTITEANGHQRTLTFDDKGRLASMTGGNCGQCSNSDVASYSYDSRNLLISEVDFNGVETRYEYNSRGLQTKRTEAYGDPLAKVITTTWHETLSLPTKVTTPTMQTDYIYGVRGRLESITETDLVNAENTARVTTYTYYDNGLLATIDGSRTDVSDVTLFTYDANFDLATITDAVGNTTTITGRNANGYPTSMTDANGVETTLSYDVRNRLIRQTVSGQVTQFTYDNIGQLTKVTLPSGAVTEYTYNGARLLTQIADGLGNSINYTYDVMGNVTKVEVKDAEGTLHATQQQVFDDLNRVTSQIDGLNNTSTFSYDAVGNQTSVKSPALKETKQVYDALNRLSETTDANAGKTTYGYDAANNLTLVKAPNMAQTTYQYDGFGSLLSQVSPDTGTTTFTYDVAGNQTSKTDANNVTVNYQYDALNRLIKIDYPTDQLDVTLTYDTGTNGKGRLSTITDGSGTTTYSYDVLGNVTSKTSTVSGKQFTVSYAYNGANQLTQITQPSGRVVQLTRDSNGLVAGISETKNGNTQNLLTSAQYVPFGGAKSFTLGNGKTQTNTHNLNGQVASINVDEVYQSTLSYNADGQITALASSVAATSNQSFSYDELDRLTEASGSYGTLGYSYDSSSNRITKTTPSITQTLEYLANSNQLAAPYTHDANGNRTQDSKRSYSYGEHNRLTEVVNEESGITTTYLYNGLGQRVKKSNVYGDVYFIYDEQGLLIAEANGLGKVTTEYIYFEGQPLVMLVGSSDGLL